MTSRYTTWFLVLVSIWACCLALTWAYIDGAIAEAQDPISDTDILTDILTFDSEGAVVSYCVETLHLDWNPDERSVSVIAFSCDPDGTSRSWRGEIPMYEER